MKKQRYQIVSILAIIAFSIFAIGVTVFMTLRNTADLTGILEDSIKAKLISTSIAARELIDVDRFDMYNSVQDVLDDYDNYSLVLEELRSLQRQTGAEYIYALKFIDGYYHFIFDTDTVVTTLFDKYEISQVHERAFLGENAAGIMNVVDEFGSFNTGAVPILRDGRVVGIISTDVADTYIQQSRAAAERNAAFLIVALVVTMAIMILIVFLLMRNVRKMQDKLFRMANYDVLTGLPNRQYMISYLEEFSQRAIAQDEPFAFMLIDLDNFKRVNDGAGHDAGDELLRHFAVYLNSLHENSKSFRPPAGALNVSARIGGDEFVQVVHGVTTIDEAQMVAKKVLENFTSQTIDRFVEKYRVGLSVGVALFPFHTDNFNVLIKYADIAMYHAKKGGKNAYCVFSHDLMQVESEAYIEPHGDGERRQFRH